MTAPALASTAATRRIGIGLVAGAVLLFALAGLLAAAVAALALVVAGLATYAAERARGAAVGVSVGLALSGVFLVLDRQLDPLGATVARSTAATAAIGVGFVAAAALVERFGGREEGIAGEE